MCSLLSDTKQNKGSILKASVDYIIQVKNDIEEAKKMQETNRYLMSINKKLFNRIKVSLQCSYLFFEIYTDSIK